jgi:hypothetical protein
MSKMGKGNQIRESREAKLGLGSGLDIKSFPTLNHALR